MIELIKKLINKTNEITYEQYMGTVLYHPEKGYYMRDVEKVGTRGDFITSSNISNVFGKIFARVFIKLIEQGQVPPVICEIGGGNGRFAKAVLDEIRVISPNYFEQLVYIIIETSPFHRQKQKGILPIGETVVQFESLTDAKKSYPTFDGILFSNELFDAFPVRVVEKRNHSINEVMVQLNENGDLEEKLSPTFDEEILGYLRKNQIRLTEGQRFEIPLAMIEYLRELASFIKSGIMITVDYGYTNDEWTSPVHHEGSLRGYYQHQLIRNPLLHPGEMDLTTHIHFDSLISYGEEVKLKFVKKLRQDEFLLQAGILTYLQENFDPNPFSEISKQNRAIRSLIMDGSMSSAFNVVIQQKNVNPVWQEILQDYK